MEGQELPRRGLYVSYAHQQGGLLAYQDDDNYVNVYRAFIGGGTVGLLAESGGITSSGRDASLANSGNLILRIDRDPTTNAFTAFYSTTGGNPWKPLPGTVTKALVNPRLGIQVGANSSGIAATADLSWVEIR